MADVDRSAYVPGEGPYVPEEVPLPPVPSTEVFTDLQWKTLLSLADTVIPSVRARDPASGSVTGSTISDKLVPVSQLNNAVSDLAKRIADNGSHSTDPAVATQLARQFVEESASSDPAFRELLQRTMAVNIHQEGKNGISLVLTALKYVAALAEFLKPLPGIVSNSNIVFIIALELVRFS